MDHFFIRSYPSKRRAALKCMKSAAFFPQTHGTITANGQTVSGVSSACNPRKKIQSLEKRFVAAGAKTPKERAKYILNTA